MSVSLDPAVSAQLDEGAVAILPLVKFTFPEMVYGCHFGGRNLDYSGVSYKPNRWLDPDSFSEALGNDVTARTLTFSNVPTEDADDAIGKLETLTYTNAPVTISYLLGDPETDEILGVLATHFFEINQVSYRKQAIQPDGTRTVTVDVEIEPVGRRVRDVTHAKRSDAEQKFDNDATDEGFKYIATSPSFPYQWGQVMR